MIKAFVSGAATCALILGLALGSNALLDRYLPVRIDKTSEILSKVTPVPEAACVDASGSWVNWPWPNVPALSPPCPDNPRETVEPAEKK